MSDKITLGELLTDMGVPASVQAEMAAAPPTDSRGAAMEAARKTLRCKTLGELQRLTSDDPMLAHAMAKALVAEDERKSISRPHIPEDVIAEALAAVRVNDDGSREITFTGFNAIQRLLNCIQTPKPATKTIEVWHVSWAYRWGDGWEAAGKITDDSREVERLRVNCAASTYANFHVTGPHQQEVPA